MKHEKVFKKIGNISGEHHCLIFDYATLCEIIHSHPGAANSLYHLLKQHRINRVGSAWE